MKPVFFFKQTKKKPYLANKIRLIGDYVRREQKKMAQN